MKLVDFLSEAQELSYKRLNLEEAVDLLKASPCKWMASEENHPFYRGDSSIPHLNVLIDPSKTNRVSSNTSNHYTLIFDNHPEMKGWPKRSKSLIASDSNRLATTYGHLYGLVPLSGASVGVVGMADIWAVSPEVMGNKRQTHDFNDIWTSLGIDDSDWEKFKAGARDLGNHLGLLRKRGFKIPEGDFDIVDEILRGYSPEKLGFKKFKAEDLKPSDVKKDTEVWVSGPCLMARIGENWNRIVELMREPS